jgi:hypothetical protein
VETAIGVVLGALATVLASRYYFLRSTRKSLGVYGLLNSAVFADIAPDVRPRLSFRYQDREVRDLRQLVFLVANDGERAISNVIEPLSLSLPDEVEILDASIIHRSPEELQASADLTPRPAGDGGGELHLRFPLLNRGDFFVVKLLLSGELDLSLKVRADDLPRILRVDNLPRTIMGQASFEWDSAAIGGGLVLVAAWASYCLYVIGTMLPNLLPIPWSTYSFTVPSALVMAPALLIVPGLAFLGVQLVWTMATSGSRRTRFPLPKQLQSSVSWYGTLELLREIQRGAEPATQPAARANEGPAPGGREKQ